MPRQAKTTEPRMQRAWGVTAAWIAGITAVIGFAGTLSGAFSSISDRFHRHKDSDAQIAVAQMQIEEHEYQQAFGTYTAVLKNDPSYKPAAEGQLNAAELWAESFELDSPQDKTAVAAAQASLDQISAVLYAALANRKGTNKADLQAHVGWVQWLQHHVFGQDTTQAAERDLRAALAIDPGNVYANAMLGYFLARTYRSISEAVPHFDTAVNSGKERAYVRGLQIAGLMRLEEPGARAAIFRAVNSMRKGGEPLDADTRLNVRGFCCAPNESTHEQWVESLSAVPSDDAMQTFIWLNATNTDLDARNVRLNESFVKALLTEMAGDKEGALRQLRDLKKQIGDTNTNVDESVEDEIARLTSANR